jgi:hypothetical protein
MIVERRAWNVMPRRHDDASSKEDASSSWIPVRIVQDHRKVIADEAQRCGGGSRKRIAGRDAAATLQWKVADRDERR